MSTIAAQAPNDPSRLAAGVLSAGMHLLLVVVLVVGVHWQSSHPQAVSVELWAQLPEPTPAPPEPKPEIKPEPPKPEIKPPPPKPEPPPPRKPDIVVEKAVKAPPREPPKPEPRMDLDLSRQMKDQVQRELESVQREREKREALSQFKPAPAPAAPVRGDPRYADQVSAKIKGLIILPPDIVGNPQAIFDVEQLPTGEVIGVKLRTSSGNRAYDEAVERAIYKASPLPRPAPPNQPPRMLELRFRPLER
jgi:colicin import membrane protein